MIMRGNLKVYDEKAAQWGDTAEREIARWLRSGHRYRTAKTSVTQPTLKNRFDRDLKVEGDNVEPFYLEIERGEFRGPRWNGPDFRFPTLHIPERRNKWAEDTLFISTNGPITLGLISFKGSWTEDRRELVPNQECENEYMFCVPTVECLKVDLHRALTDPLPVMNYRRVLGLLDEADKITDGYRRTERIKRILGEYPPAGMTQGEYEDRRNEADQIYRKKRGDADQVRLW
jgi:hypothetical protein